MTTFFTIFFFIALIVAAWISWCTESYRVGVYRDKGGKQHKVPLVQHVPVDYELLSVELYTEIVRGIGKGKSFTI